MVTTPRTSLGREDRVCARCNHLHIFAFACMAFREGDPLQDLPFPIRFSRWVQRIRAWKKMKAGEGQGTQCPLRTLLAGVAECILTDNGGCQPPYRSLGEGGAGRPLPARGEGEPGVAVGGGTKGCMGDAGPNWSDASWPETTRRRQRLGQDSRALGFNPAEVLDPSRLWKREPRFGTATQRSEPPEAKVPQVHQRRAQDDSVWVPWWHDPRQGTSPPQPGSPHLRDGGHVRHSLPRSHGPPIYSDSRPLTVPPP